VNKKTTDLDSYQLKISDRSYGFFIYYYDEVRGHILLFAYPTHLKFNDSEKDILAIHPAWWHQERFLKSERFNTMDLELSGVVYSATLFLCDARRLKRRSGMDTEKWRQERFILIVKAPSEVSFIAQEILQEFYTYIDKGFKGKLCYLVENDLGLETTIYTKEELKEKAETIENELSEICQSLIPSVPIKKLSNLFDPIVEKEKTSEPNSKGKKLRFSVPVSRKSKKKLIPKQEKGKKIMKKVRILPYEKEGSELIIKAKNTSDFDLKNVTLRIYESQGFFKKDMKVKQIKSWNTDEIISLVFTPDQDEGMLYLLKITDDHDVIKIKRILN
jgi:hypothetical protein